MNRTQLKVLWVGIGIIVLMGLFPPGTHGGYDLILEARSVSLGRLIIEWAIVVAVTGGLIYSLKVDSELMLKIACAFLYLWGMWRKQSYREYFEQTRNKKEKANVFRFWVVVLILLLLVLIAIRLSVPARPPLRRGGL